MSSATTNQQPSPGSLYSRLSSFYFLYYAAIGVFVPYWTVYLHEIKGFSSSQIGELMATFMLIKIAAPFAWGWLTDHSKSRIGMIRLACLLLPLGFSFSYVSDSYWEMMLVISVFSFFWNAALPQFEALTLNHLESRANRYSQVRLWGSVGFIIIVVLLPLVIESYGTERVLDVMLMLFILLWGATWLVPDKVQPTTSVNVEHIKDVLRRPAVWVLLLACTLQVASHGAYYTFFSLYLKDHGYSHVFIGWMWALGVIVEVLVFLVMYRLMQAYGAARLFVIALFLTAIRWLMLGAAVDYLLILLMAQVLHAATFGLFHASAIDLIHHHFPGRLQGRGQALYAGLSSGLGGAIGGLLSGYSWDGLGNEITFYISAGVAAVAGVMAWVFVGREQPAEGAHLS